MITTQRMMHGSRRYEVDLYVYTKTHPRFVRKRTSHVKFYIKGYRHMDEHSANPTRNRCFKRVRDCGCRQCPSEPIDRPGHPTVMVRDLCALQTLFDRWPIFY